MVENRDKEWFTLQELNKNAIVVCLDYQIPVTHLMRPKGNEDMQAAKRD